MHGAYDDTPQHIASAPGARATAAAMPAVGSAEWISQLQKIKDVCQKAQVDYTLIDGFLAASGAPQQFPQPHPNPFQTVPDAFAASRASETPSGVDYDNAQNNFQEVEEIGLRAGLSERLNFENIQDILMDTDMVGDDCLVAAWAP
jgi:hypothetical protein